MRRSVLLHLLRERCNACELAFVADCTELEMQRRIAALEVAIRLRAGLRLRFRA